MSRSTSGIEQKGESDFVRAIVLDAMGVMFLPGDDVGEILIPFARSRGCELSDSEITRLYVRCSLGDFTSKEFWGHLGLLESGEYLDSQYVLNHRLTRGLKSFLSRVRAKGIPVVCLSNDVAAWSMKLRRIHNLEQHVARWIVSSEVGARKPDREIFHRYWQETGYPIDESLFVDDRVANLDAARSMGFRTVLFRIDGHPVSRSDHAIARSFEEVERCAQM